MEPGCWRRLCSHGRAAFCADVPSLHHTTFPDIERQLESMFDEEVTVEIMEAGKEENSRGEHSYNINSGVGGCCY